MKKTLFLFISAVALVLAPSLLRAQNAKKGKVLLIAREGKFRDFELMLNNEVGVMRKLLQQAGFEVKVASPSGRPIVVDAKTLKPDLKLSDVKMTDYAGFVIPCLSLDEGLPADFVPTIKKAIATGLPVAAQAGGVIALARMGALSGKKYALWVAPEKAAFPEVYTELKRAVYNGTGVVQDGNIITSGVCPMGAKNTGLPDGTSLLTQTLIAALLKK